MPTKCRYSLQPDPKSGRLGRCMLTTSKRCPRSAVVACSHRPRSTADASCRMAAVAPCRTKLTTKRCIDTCESRVASASRCSAASGPRWRSTTAVPACKNVLRVAGLAVFGVCKCDVCGRPQAVRGGGGRVEASRGSRRRAGSNLSKARGWPGVAPEATRGGQTSHIHISARSQRRQLGWSHADQAGRR